MTAPFKLFKPKPKSDHWHTSNTRLLRQACRKAERKWQKDRLQSSYDLLKICLRGYQNAAKAAKAAYFSNIISTNYHRPKVLLSIINTALAPPVNHTPNPSNALCESFLSYFIDKISKLRPQAIPPYVGACVSTQPLTSWEVFDPISPLHLTEIIANLKTSFYPQDVIHPRFLKLIVDSVGPGLLSLLNKCLLTGSVPT